jgi:urease accessory protein
MSLPITVTAPDAEAITETAAVSAPSAPEKSHWQARLQLGFSKDAETTRLTERQHSGPLRVQKPLYPEGAEICHAIIIHPPGGVVGGDELQIRATLGEGTHALITTPGAAKWYRGNGYTSKQAVVLHVADGAVMEWLPQETIFFDDACVSLHQDIHLSGNAAVIASDILCFGRTAAGETYTSGNIWQHSRIYRDGKLIWFEQGCLEGDGESMQSPLGLAGRSVSGMVLAAGAMLSSAQLLQLREESRALLDAREPQALCGVTQMKSVLVARYLGNSSEVARAWMQLVWQHLRPVIARQPARIPRIWNT